MPTSEDLLTPVGRASLHLTGKPPCPWTGVTGRKTASSGAMIDPSVKNVSGYPILSYSLLFHFYPLSILNCILWVIGLEETAHLHI